MNRRGNHPTAECPLFSEFVADFASLEQIALPSSHTVMLIAADTRGVAIETVARVAGRLLASGLVYICVWGPDCKRVHDIFDEVHIGDGTVAPDFTLMSTWHSDEPLEEAIWFFLWSAFSFHTDIAATSYVAVTVGSTDWAATVDDAFSDLAAYNTRMTDDGRGASG